MCCLRCCDITRASSSPRSGSLAHFSNKQKTSHFSSPARFYLQSRPLTYDAERLLARGQSCCVANKVKLCVPERRSARFFYSLERRDVAAALNCCFHATESSLLWLLSLQEGLSVRFVHFCQLRRQKVVQLLVANIVLHRCRKP